MNRGNEHLRARAAVIITTLALVATAVVWIGCSSNDPFDPGSVQNARPVVRFFVEAVDTTGGLQPTSYNNRTFHWSGSDRDGYVVAYYVSIRLQSDVPAPWDTTTATDTTMTFTTDDNGNAEATIYLACRDDRGAISDTLVQYVPLKNFPPALNFQSDYDPHTNLQREIHYDGTTPTDTTYWNWGQMNARFFTLDLDGNDTLDPHYYYTLADTDPDSVCPFDQPGADPEVCWIQVPLSVVGDVLEFEIGLHHVAPGDRTLTVKVVDEAEAESRIQLHWQVRAPRSSVLVIPDNYGTAINTLWAPFLDSYFGPGGYDRYDFWLGFPDRAWVLLESLRNFDVVVWLGGGATSPTLIRAAAGGGVLEQYVHPLDGSAPGRLLLASRAFVGSTGHIPGTFLASVFGTRAAADPSEDLVPTSAAVGIQALGSTSDLPPVTLVSTTGRGAGIYLLAGSEALYQFETCERCFGRRAREVPPPWEPIIAIRRPTHADSQYADAIGISFQLEAMNHDEALAALAAIFATELGVAQP